MKNCSNSSITHLSFAFAFFVHGESTVCASIDVRQHPPIRRLNKAHLAQSQSSSKGLPVILSPFGLLGHLNNVQQQTQSQQTCCQQSNQPPNHSQEPQHHQPTQKSTLDINTSLINNNRILEEWMKFFPIKRNHRLFQQSSMVTANVLNKSNDGCLSQQQQQQQSQQQQSQQPSQQNQQHHHHHHQQQLQQQSLPNVVEVIVGGVRMKYPTCYVLLTDIDEITHVSNQNSYFNDDLHKNSKCFFENRLNPLFLDKLFFNQNFCIFFKNYSFHNGLTFTL